MRRTGVMMAVLSFFVLAIVGWASGVTPFVCAVRALIGAVVAYVLTRIAERVVIRIMADAMLRGPAEDKGSGDETGQSKR